MELSCWLYPIFLQGSWICTALSGKREKRKERREKRKEEREKRKEKREERKVNILKREEIRFKMRKDTENKKPTKTKKGKTTEKRKKEEIGQQFYICQTHEIT